MRYLSYSLLILFACEQIHGLEEIPKGSEDLSIPLLSQVYHAIPHEDLDEASATGSWLNQQRHHDPSTSDHKFQKVITSLKSNFEKLNPAPVFSSSYSVYYDLAKTISEEAPNEEVRHFAEYIRNLGPKIHPQREIQDSDSSTSVVAYIKSGLRSLNKDTLQERERMWILGTLATLEKYLPKDFERPYETKLTRKASSMTRGEFELILTRGKIGSREVKNLWVGPSTSNEVSNLSTKEALHRFELIQPNFIQGARRKLVKAAGELETHLIHTVLPRTKEQATAFVMRIDDIFMKEDSPRWLKVSAHDICLHFAKYDQRTEKELITFMRRHDDFTKGFHRIQASRAMSDIIYETFSGPKFQELLQPFANLENLKSEALVRGMRAIISVESGLNMRDRVRLYEAVTAAAPFFEKDYWMEEIYHHSILPKPLASVWVKLFPNLEPEPVSILDYQFWMSLTFSKVPKLLDAARRSAIGQTLKPEYGLEKLMKLDWKQLESSDDVDTLFTRLVNVLQEDGRYRSYTKNQMQVFEALCQLMIYNPVYETRLLDSIKKDYNLHIAISAVAKKVRAHRHENLKSGIAPIQLEATSTRLLTKMKVPITESFVPADGVNGYFKSGL